jgi:hypothetical protein
MIPRPFAPQRHIVPLTAKLRLLARSARRWLIPATTCAIGVGLLWYFLAQHDALGRTSFSSGYVLLGCVVLLVSLNWRKQAPSLPLGKVSTWLEWHLNIGFLTVALFAFHTGMRFTTGILDTMLFCLFLLVAGSGLYGLYATRAFPRRLRALPDEVVYEAIPHLRAEIAAEAERMMLDDAFNSEALVELYRSALAPFLRGPRPLWYWLKPGSSQRRRLVAALRELERYLDPKHSVANKKLIDLVCRKDDLDYHAALQGRLKLWMFAHIAGSYSLLLLAVVHGLIAHLFAGGTR